MRKAILLTMMSFFISSSANSLPKTESFTPIHQNINIDGNDITYVSASEVYVNGVRLREAQGDDVDIISNHINGTSENFKRPREATIQCKVTLYDGTSIYLTQVSGGGAPSTYWISFVDSTGIHTYPNDDGVTCNDIRL